MKRLALLLLLPSGAAAQVYPTPDDYRMAEAQLSRGYAECLGSGYDNDLACALEAQARCHAHGPNGETTAGYAICSGVLANILDRELNATWSDLRAVLPAAEFEALRQAQRAWLAWRDDETRAAAARYPGGSMAAYSGGLRNTQLTAERVARLREIRSAGTWTAP